MKLLNESGNPMYKSSKLADADQYISLDKVDGKPKDLRSKQPPILIVDDESIDGGTVTPDYQRERDPSVESCLTANAPLNVSGEMTAPQSVSDRQQNNRISPLNQKPILIEDADGLLEFEKCSLKKKIDVLFDNAVTSSDRVTPVSRLNAIEAKDDILQWGEIEFGLTDGEK